MPTKLKTLGKPQHETVFSAVEKPYCFESPRRTRDRHFDTSNANQSMTVDGIELEAISSKLREKFATYSHSKRQDSPSLRNVLMVLEAMIHLNTVEKIAREYGLSLEKANTPLPLSHRHISEGGGFLQPDMLRKTLGFARKMFSEGSGKGEVIFFAEVKVQNTKADGKPRMIRMLVIHQTHRNNFTSDIEQLLRDCLNPPNKLDKSLEMVRKLAELECLLPFEAAVTPSNMRDSEFRRHAENAMYKEFQDQNLSEKQQMATVNRLLKTQTSKNGKPLIDKDELENARRHPVFQTLYQLLLNALSRLCEHHLKQSPSEVAIAALVQAIRAMLNIAYFSNRITQCLGYIKHLADAMRKNPVWCSATKRVLTLGASDVTPAELADALSTNWLAITPIRDEEDQQREQIGQHAADTLHRLACAPT